MIGISEMRSISMTLTKLCCNWLCVQNYSLHNNNKIYFTLSPLPLKIQGASVFRSSVTGILTLKSKLWERTLGKLCEVRNSSESSSQETKWIKYFIVEGKSVNWTISRTLYGTTGKTRGMSKVKTRTRNLSWKEIVILIYPSELKFLPLNGHSSKFYGKEL